VDLDQIGMDMKCALDYFVLDATVQVIAQISRHSDMLS
jgi:hypothetical protein